ncbi:hypothetical protein KR222_001592, partial [Zaprionus bogoriensis]
KQRAQTFVVYVEEYCRNCTLVGFAYIANSHLHPSERIFWLISVIVSALGVFYLINEYRKDFDTRAVSIVYESVPVLAPVKFPSLCVCQTDPGSDYGGGLEDYVQSMGRDLNGPYNFAVETYVTYILFPDTYSENLFYYLCDQTKDCEECAKCPLKDYRLIAKTLGLNCSDIFIECRLSGVPFDCCNYFLPMTTPYGACYMLNSLQNNHPSSGHWLPTVLDRNNQPQMKLKLKRSSMVSITNEEDLPYVKQPVVFFNAQLGKKTEFQFYMESLVNDPEIRNIPVAARDCYFPDEIPATSLFRAYSFSACISDCTRKYQLQICNCSLYNFNPFNDERLPDCGFEEYVCAQSHGLIQTDFHKLKEYNSEVNCGCLPSCTEADLKNVYEYNEPLESAHVTMSMSMWPTNQYRRQALRTSLDVVVSIGGILGLFLGASILSAIEFLYYFTIRAVNTRRAARFNRT